MPRTKSAPSDIAWVRELATALRETSREERPEGSASAREIAEALGITVRGAGHRIEDWMRRGWVERIHGRDAGNRPRFYYRPAKGVSLAKLLSR